MNSRIYLDNSATTRVDEQVLDAVIAHMRDVFGNPSSIHTFGQQARAAVEDSRQYVAELLGAEPREIVFTSGGTESDNTALLGVLRRAEGPGKHIVTTKIEHPAVLAACKRLEASGVEVTYVAVDSAGRLDPLQIERAINERTILISVMHANNETGVIQPIEEIAAIARNHKVLLHTDAVQSVGKVPLDVTKLGVDLLSLSGHKMHAPKGIGALFVRHGTRLAPFMVGGSHERKRRAGTENVPGIVGLGVAARLARERLPEMQSRVAGLRDNLVSMLCSLVKDVRVNGTDEFRLPTIANLSFAGLEGEAAVIALDLEGVAVSTGSACSSGSLEPSHVLTGMGLRAEVVQSSLRFSLCYHSTKMEIDYAVDAMVRVAERLRRLSRRALS